MQLTYRRPLLRAFLGAAILCLMPAVVWAVPPPDYEAHLQSGFGGPVAQYYAAGSYSLGGASASCDGIPTVTVHAHTTEYAIASTTAYYYYTVSGPDTSAIVPLTVSFYLHASASGDYQAGVTSDGRANITASGFNTSFMKDLEAANSPGTPRVLNASGRGSFEQIADGRVGYIRLLATSQSTDGGSADAYADPNVSIDPTWANANPGYSVTLSQGVGNGAPLPTVVSRKVHGAAGTFDIPLPFSDTPGVECRSGGANGTHQVVFTFASPVNPSTTASIVSGPGSVSNTVVNGNVVTVDLAGMINAQTATILLNGNDSGPVALKMGFLLGDTTGDGFVNGGDSIQTRNRSGQATSASNFRSDVNLDGFVNSGDSVIVRSRSGTALP